MRLKGFPARLVVGVVAVALALAFASTAGAARYLVVYKGEDVPANAATQVQKAGGQLVRAYDQIGVAVADSENPSFAAILEGDKKVDGVGAVAGLSFGLEHHSDDWDGELPNIPATDADTFSAMQWNMQQIHAPEAHAITGGSPEVVVGLLDSGIDYTHPDLAQNVDFADSASCVTGVPDTNPEAWKDDNGHGTHTTGIAVGGSAAGTNIGVAPGAKWIAAKAWNDADEALTSQIHQIFQWFLAPGGDPANAPDVVNGSWVDDPGCIELMARFIRERPELWNEDIAEED